MSAYDWVTIAETNVKQAQAALADHDIAKTARYYVAASTAYKNKPSPDNWRMAVRTAYYAVALLRESVNAGCRQHSLALCNALYGLSTLYAEYLALDELADKTKAVLSAEIKTVEVEAAAIESQALVTAQKSPIEVTLAAAAVLLQEVADVFFAKGMPANGNLAWLAAAAMWVNTGDDNHLGRAADLFRAAADQRDKSSSDAQKRTVVDLLFTSCMCTLADSTLTPQSGAFTTLTFYEGYGWAGSKEQEFVFDVMAALQGICSEEGRNKLAGRMSNDDLITNFAARDAWREGLVDKIRARVLAAVPLAVKVEQKTPFVTTTSI